MIVTVRGFVLKLEIGRAGLVRVFIVHEDGSIGVYVINDLDADPERFNERLSKLGLLRDAMNRAESVEIEFSSGQAGNVVERVVRISRDALRPVRNVIQITGLVLDVLLHSENGTAAEGEKHDIARIHVASTTLKNTQLILDMQAPERLVAVEQLEMIREAQQAGNLVRFLVDTSPQNDEQSNLPGRGEQRIIAVAVDFNLDAFGAKIANPISGFVESISLMRFGGDGDLGQFAHVRFTTAPPFSGPGGTVGLVPFTPITLDLLVPKKVPTYDLFEAGLRDNLRMRANVILLEDLRQLDDPDNPTPVAGTPPVGVAANNDRSQMLFNTLRRSSSTTAAASDERQDIENVGLAFTAELLAHLASASRPVWITIARESLDYGSEGSPCTDGVPTSDLAPRSLRDLRIPYLAVWTGFACFNPGIYRFQLCLPTQFTLFVDGKELCLHDAESDKGIKLAHACLSGEHEIRIEIRDWICDYEFIMDVYQLR